MHSSKLWVPISNHSYLQLHSWYSLATPLQQNIQFPYCTFLLERVYIYIYIWSNFSSRFRFCVAVIKSKKCTWIKMGRGPYLFKKFEKITFQKKKTWFMKRHLDRIQNISKFFNFFFKFLNAIKMFFLINHFLKNKFTDMLLRPSRLREYYSKITVFFI